jgi:hypothetical protein
MTQRHWKMRVRDMDTGEVWGSLQEAAEAIGVTQSALTVSIREHRPCRGRWIVPVEETMCACCKGIVERKRLSPNYGQAA